MSRILAMLGLFVAVFQADFTGQAFAQPAEVAAELTDIGTRRFGQDWPKFLGPGGDSKSAETGIRKDWSDGKLPIVWSKPLEMSYGICTVVKGRVFQFDGRPLARGSNVGVLFCLNAETGEEIWKFEYPYAYQDQYGYNNGPRTSPLIDGERAYLYGVAGNLICVDTTNGKKVWSVDTAKEYGVIQNFFGVGSNPVIVGDLIVAMVGGSPMPARIDRAKGNGTGIVAFNKFTGKEAYRLSDELASYASLMTWGQDREWCFAFMRGGLLAFEPTSGTEEFFFPWRAKVVESVNASQPIVFGSKVFISETYGPGSALLNIAKSETGEANVVWQDPEKSRRKSMQTHWNTPIHKQGLIYGSSGRHSSNAELRCIDAKTGEVRWSEPGLGRASLLLVEDHLICLGETGELILLKASGEKYDVVTKWQVAQAGEPMLKYPAWAAPILSHGLMYARGKDKLVCFELIPVQGASGEPVK